MVGHMQATYDTNTFDSRANRALVIDTPEEVDFWDREERPTSAKIIWWDTRSGDFVQEYERYLGTINFGD
ncbi:hypothetical protein pipiens_013749 [Culex pipiens pipiens]|uniref:Uncharacterized protein n=1 Tax=Culex pipiens pipiens TaxID=38569 RepID=A0ABD1CX73_CULPP